MLTDSSLTNTLTLCGISNIRYRVYTLSYQKSTLLSFFSCQDLNTKSPSYIKVEKPQNSLMAAFRHLLGLNIPCVWQIVPSQDKELIVLELSVFWFDDKHTDIIDSNTHLKELKELRVGSFNWDQLTAQSPTTPPKLNRSTTEHATLISPGNDYNLFIKSIRNLVHNSLTERGALSLGEFFIFPDTYLDNKDIIDTIADQSRESAVKNTMLACMYNIYLTSSNLVFQPNTRRMRIRPLTSKDIYTKNKKVLLCPTGEHACLISFQSLPTHELQERVLEQWAEFYHLTYSQLLSSQNDDLPSLVTIRTASGDTITYPTVLIFVPTDTKLSPSAVSGLNGIMGLNHGLTEDLGSKASRSAYYESLKSNNPGSHSIIDYWSYHDPITFASNVIINALSMADTNYQQDQLLLHRALIEPVISSPIMNSKSVIPINTTPLLGNHFFGNYAQYTTPPKSSLNSNMNLTEFATSRFQSDEPVEAILDSLNPLNDPNIAINSDKNLDLGGSHLSTMLQNNLNIDSTLPVDSNASSTSIQPQDSILGEQTQPPLPLDDLNLYNIDGGINGSWNDNEDFGDLDLDVTEADFDFFEIPAPVVTPNNVLHIMSMDVDPPAVTYHLPTREPSESHGDIPKHIETTPNNDSLFTPFVISNSNSENTSIEGSTNTAVELLGQIVTPAKADYLQTDSTRRISIRKSTPEHSTFVPHDFLPVPINTNDIDAKYEAGGKFMYDPLKETNHSKRGLYSPDYVPNVKKKSIKKSPTNIVKPESINSLQDVEMTDAQQDNSSNNGSNDSSGSETTKSGGSSSSGSYTDDDSDTDDYFDDSISIEKIVDKRLRSLKKFQRNIVYSLLKATPAPSPIDRFQNIDYDSPFTPILTDGYIKPIKWRQSKAMERSMDYLCQQAILGGYPFASGLAEVSANGGEIEAESAKVLVARRTNIMQMTRGVVTHVPSLQTDAHKLTMEFKSILKQIFLEGPFTSTLVTSDGMNTPKEEGVSLHPMSYLSGPLLGSVDIQGPLTIQQYYNLNDVPNQAHSKYGRYQIKKRRPDQPNLDLLKKPDIVVSRNEDFLEGSSKMLPFWEKLGLEPYSAKKQVNYLVMYPNNTDIEASVCEFFQNLSTVYDTCRLGKHIADCIGPYRNGLVPVPLSATEDHYTSVKLKLKSYEETCENLGRYLACKNDQKMVYNVIYMINPGPHMSSYLDMCRCFYKLKEAYKQASDKNDQNRIVLQLVPIDHILRSSAFGGYKMLGMKDIAFSVYAKCFSTISRQRNSAITTDLYAPPFVLSKPIQKTIDFKLNDIRAFPILLDKDATLHMAYCFSYDRAWMSIVWTDGRGGLLEYSLFPRKTAYKEAWERTLEIAKRTDFPWTIIITKVGLIFKEELLHWLKYISNTHEYGVAIIGLDLESELNLHFNTGFSDTTAPSNIDRNQQSSILSDYFARSHTIAGCQQEKNLKNSKNVDIVNEAQSLLLNHRISYSQKRERAYKGILRAEAITEKESWMTPLATGYMINHSLPNKNVNPCIEQFNNEPFVAEIHLIYNHTQHSAYNTLQDIIKRLYALSFVNPIPSSHSCIPFHVVLAERLSRLLLIIDESCK